MTAPVERQSTPSLREFVENRLDAKLAGLRVALPARVTRYDKDRQCVNAQPLIDQGYFEAGERVSEALPIVTDVPIVFPGSGPFRMTFPIAVGDFVLLVVASSSIARWKVTGKGGDPGDDRHHRLSDAIAIPGLATLAKQPTEAPTDALVLHADEVKLGGPGATSAVVVESALDDFMTALAQAIATLGLGPASAPLAALQTKLLALNAAQGWTARTTKAKAE